MLLYFTHTHTHMEENLLYCLYWRIVETLFLVALYNTIIPPPTPLLCAHGVFPWTDKRNEDLHPLYFTPFFFPFLHILVLLLPFKFPQSQPAASLCVPAHLFTHHSECSITISAIVALDHGLYLITPLLLLHCFHFLLFAFSLERRQGEKESDTSSDQIDGSVFFSLLLSW